MPRSTGGGFGAPLTGFVPNGAGCDDDVDGAGAAGVSDTMACLWTVLAFGVELFVEVTGFGALVVGAGAGAGAVVVVATGAVVVVVGGGVTVSAAGCTSRVDGCSSPPR